MIAQTQAVPVQICKGPKMPKESVIRVDKAGCLTFLHDDNITAVLKKDGDISMVRASDVKFDNQKKLWYVYYPGSPARMIDKGFVDRSEALDYEKKWLETRL